MTYIFQPKEDITFQEMVEVVKAMRLMWEDRAAETWIPEKVLRHFTKEIPWEQPSLDFSSLEAGEKNEA